MGSIREIADQLWRGETHTPPMFAAQGLEEYAPGLAFVGGFANLVALDTAEGLVLIDTGSHLAAAGMQAAVRTWSQRPLHTAIYTHGHIDHVMGTRRYEAEPGAKPARVIAHEAVPARFDRYRLTAGYNGIINARQFGLPGLAWPTDYRYPDEVYARERSLRIGDEQLELHHARGETDDHTWLWLPARKVLCTGDLFIWASPNCGNPQKVQRYPRDWAVALRVMHGLGAELLLPGHGPPIEGAARVAQALDETARLLETLHDQTLELMNQGATLDAVVRAVQAPPELLARPYLRPVYDDPEFIVRSIWRLYGGWWDGNPAHLKPPAEAALASELAAQAGGAGKLADRAAELSAAGQHALACQLIDWALRADADAGIQRRYVEIYQRRAAVESSLMAKGIFSAAAAEPKR